MKKWQNWTRPALLRSNNPQVYAIIRELMKHKVCFANNNNNDNDRHLSVGRSFAG
jgi:hypothetical protein